MELHNFAQWAYTRLSGDATLAGLAPGGVHENVAPEGTAEPFVVFSLVTNRDVNAVGQTRALVNADWDVKVVGQGASYAPLVAAADRIDALLHDVQGGVVISSHRVATIRYVEPSDGTTYRHLGGTYRTQLSS